VVVLHWDDNELASASRYTSEALRVADPERESATFIAQLLALAPRLAGAVLMPTSDDAVKALARHKSALEQRFVVACPDWGIVERYVDKRHTYELARECGVAIPTTVMPDGARDVRALGARLTYPCLVKPVESHLYTAQFGRKVAVARSSKELREAHSAAADAGLEVMFQELIPGRDHLGVNYNAYRAGTEFLAECTARKVRLSPPRFGTPRVVISADVPDVVRPGRTMLHALGLEGFACTEFKRDPRDGVYKLLDINGRHNLSTLLSTRCGVNFPWISFRHATAGERPGQLAARTGLYWIDELMEFRRGLTRAGRDGASPRELLRPWRREHVFAVFDRDDPAPFRKGLVRLADRGLRLTAGTVHAQIRNGHWRTR
jgi:D-aspartate ligase